MVFGLFRRKDGRAAALLYDGLMRASRDPAFFSGIGVADSIEGRLEMLMLHVGLMVHRLTGEPAGQDLARELSERFVDDIERSLRDIGYDDSGLKRRLKAVARGFYGRMEATAAALADPLPSALEAVLVRNVFAGKADGAALDTLAAHVRRLQAAYAAVSVDELAAGRLPTPPVSAISLDPDSNPNPEPEADSTR